MNHFFTIKGVWYINFKTKLEMIIKKSVLLICNIFTLIILSISKANSKLKNSNTESTIASTQIVIDLPDAVKNFVSSREMRKHHYLWHSCRNNWSRLNQATRNILTNMGWNIERPSRDRNGNVLRNNNSGQDFLCMHRDMISQINNILAQGDYAYGKKIIGWPNIPRPGDIDYPVPPPYGNSFIASVKSDSFYYNTLLPLETRYKKSYLSSDCYIRTIGC